MLCCRAGLVDVPEYDLPEASIAQTPVEPRDSARLLDARLFDVGHPEASLVDRVVSELPWLVEPGDVVVVNNTKVLPARLRLRKVGGGAAEVLLLTPDPADSRSWSALVRPGRRLPPGCVLGVDVGDGGAPDKIAALVEVGERLDGGLRQVRLLDEAESVLARCGEMALPPYIKAALEDPERYQTVYADVPRSVAAPTAGLHLTRSVLDGLASRGADLRTVDLAVGLGTFRPVKVDRAEDHEMHSESYEVPESTWEACLAARRDGRRVVAVGTTTVRALESAGATGRLRGQSSLFIRPGFEWSVTDVLLTNFHQPRSTLLLLLEAFVGPSWRHMYAEALRRGYRFLSFGDAMIASRLMMPGR